MQQLGAQDSQFIYMESSENLSNVTMVSIYRQSTRRSAESVFEQVKNHVHSRLGASPIFRRKLVRVPLDLDFPYWADDEYFDYESHLHRHSLNSPGNWRQFTEIVGRIHSRPLDMNRPVWEIHLVENLNKLPGIPAGSFGLLTKLHHAAVDGAAMVKFFSCLSDIDANGTPAADVSVEVTGAGDPPTAREMWRQGLANYVRSPLKLSQTLLKASPSFLPPILNALKRSQVEETASRVPTTPLNKRISPRKIFDGVEFKLADLKHIQKAVPGSKINDVVLAISSGAMRKYLHSHDQLPDESLVGWVPINTREKGGEGAEKTGNSITAMTTVLHTDIEDPIERLRAITRQTQLSKAAKTGVAVRLMTDISQNMPGATLALASRVIVGSGATAKLCNLAISNVPGPQVPMYMNGAQCLQQFGLVPLGEGLGLFLVALSYNGKITISVTTTREIVPDSRLLCRHLESALAELKRAAKKVLAK